MFRPRILLPMINFRHYFACFVARDLAVNLQMITGMSYTCFQGINQSNIATYIPSFHFAFCIGHLIPYVGFPRLPY